MRSVRRSLIWLAAGLAFGGGLARAEVVSTSSRRAEQLGAVNYLKLATDFADCMIKYGRDRYGKVHSPLMSNILTREKEPKITPYPLFAEMPKSWKANWTRRTANWEGPKAGYYFFHKFDFNKILNYPPGLGGEGPHKVTLYGCDPYEDRELYYTLFDLSRITGEPRFKQEAEKALTWWFRNTQGPSGLYPWGEHLGWDFQYDCPTYFDGPSKHLYAACYHEIKDTVPFLEILAGLPAAKAGEHTPLEKYALGIWRWHFWDKQRAIYCRHGDYLAKDDRKGSLESYPAHLGAYMRVWTAAYLNTKNPQVKKELERAFNTVLDVQIARTKKYGFVPFTFEPDVKGKDPGKSPPGQSIRLARHAAELSLRMKDADAGIAAKLAELARLHLGQEKFEQTLKDMKVRLAGGDVQAKPGARPKAEVRDLSRADTPGRHAAEIVRLLQWYKIYEDGAYLKAAEKQGRLACVRFMDDTCPLPKAYAGGPRKTAEGKAFPDFYFRGAALMRAFAFLGEALKSGSGK